MEPLDSRAITHFPESIIVGFDVLRGAALEYRCNLNGVIRSKSFRPQELRQRQTKGAATFGQIPKSTLNGDDEFRPAIAIPYLAGESYGAFPTLDPITG